MKLDEEKQGKLGLRVGHVIKAGGVMKYVAGCVTRERERLARVFDKAGQKDLAAAIRDASKDDQVFKWNGPEVNLDAPPGTPERGQLY